MKALIYFILLAALSSCITSNLSIETKALNRIKSLDPEAQSSINALIEMIEVQSLVTDPGAKHYVPYEFRIPVSERKKRQVHRIDPSVSFIKRSDSYQCIGDNATKENVFKIIALPFTSKIKFCPYE